MKKITIVSLLVFLISLSVRAKGLVQEISSQDFYWTELLLFLLSLFSITYFSIKRIDKPRGIYKIILISFFAGILGGMLGVISIYSTNSNCNETHLIILSGSLTGMFLAMALCSFYRTVGILIGALIGFTLGSITSTAIIFHQIPWNIVVLGIVFASTNVVIVNYRLKKAYR